MLQPISATGNNERAGWKEIYDVPYSDAVLKEYVKKVIQVKS
jgi:hypothetical protein